MGLAYARQPVEWPPAGQRPCRSIRFARLTPAHRHLPFAAPVRRGAFADERRIVVANKAAGPQYRARVMATGTPLPRLVSGHRRACASLVASFAAGVRELALERLTALHNTVPVATFRRDASALCSAFADERRVVGGDEGGRCTSSHWFRSPPMGRGSPFDPARSVGARTGDAFRTGAHRRNLSRCRCGALVDEQRVVVGDDGGLGADAKRSPSPAAGAAPRLP
jgi:hypothetical protein